MDFKPSKDYKSLLKQAKALAAVVTSKEAHCSFLEKSNKDLRLQLAMNDQSQVDALRNENEELTNQLERAIDLLISPSCEDCSNRGKVNGLSQESCCESCLWHGRDWKKNNFKPKGGE